MTLADHVRTLGRGPGRSRALTRDEADAAMSLMLSGTAAPQAIGALLMLLRMKGETAEEIAGMARAAQRAIPPLPSVDLDWPSYAAGRSRGLPWFLLAARLVARAGYRVLIHGWNGRDAALRAHLPAAGIARAQTAAQIDVALVRDGIAYVPLEAIHPGLFDLLTLRDTLGLRSCVNTLCRMFNPGRARAGVQGVFHPSYRLLQADAAALLGQPCLTVIKGGGGEVERHPGKDVAGFGLRHGAPWQGVYPALRPTQLRLSETASCQTLGMLWSGAHTDPAATEIVIGTAAVALDTLGARTPETFARDLWYARHDILAA
jgi:anthranilate phosphoribosyltransferase